MAKTINIQIKVERVTELINLLKELDSKEMVNWDHFSERFLERGDMKPDELITLVETFDSKISYRRLVRNDKITWTKELLIRFANKLIWDDESLYKNLEMVNVDLIDTFLSKWNWKWLGRYIVRRDVSLEILLRYRNQWSYLPTYEWDIVTGGGLVDMQKYLEADSIFDNPHIDWSNKEYKSAFQQEIEEYKQHVRQHYKEEGVKYDESILFNQFHFDSL